MKKNRCDSCHKRETKCVLGKRAIAPEKIPKGAAETRFDSERRKPDSIVTRFGVQIVTNCTKGISGSISMSTENRRVYSLPIIESSQKVQVQSAGQLQSMLGPAIRGIVARRWKNTVCHHTEYEQQTRWKYCKGCEHNSTCSYGQIFEPDIPAGVHLLGGNKEAPRSFVIRPEFPLPTQARVGQVFEIRILFIGEQREPIDQFWSHLETAFQNRATGLGHDRVKIVPIKGTRLDLARRIQLSEPTEGEILSKIEIHLTTPLMIFQKDHNNEKELVTRPSMLDLMRSGLQLLGPLFRCRGNPLPDELFVTLKEMASQVRMLESGYKSWSQHKRSNRSLQEWDMQGIIGKGVYGSVPVSLVPWLKAMGQIHIGTHRIIGAGGWEVRA